MKAYRRRTPLIPYLDSAAVPWKNLLTRGIGGCVGSRPCLDGSGEEKISSTVRDLNPEPFSFSLYPL